MAYSATFYLDDAEGRSQFYKSFLVSLGVTHALKFAINAKRPNNEGGLSLPSGHTSAAFQGATFIYQRYGWQYGLAAYAYLGAVFVGYSRIEADKHHIEDVFLGAAVGMVSSFYFTKPYKDFSITPVVSKNYYGISIEKSW